MRWAGHITRMGQWRGTHVLMAIPEGKWQLGRTWHKCEDNIKTDLQEVGQRSIDLARDRDRWHALVNAVMNLLVSQHAGNFLTSWWPACFSRTVLHGLTGYCHINQNQAATARCG